MSEASVEAASALAALGYAVDFSSASLAEVDRFFDSAECATALAGDTGGKLFLIGAYVGEVIRRAIGGSWIPGDDEPVLALPTGDVTSPLLRVAMRRQSAVDGIAAYGAIHGLITTRAEATSTMRR
jgi:hypothetical protein